ncbi:unnamed protein product [Darwinula stevensoni]|uniref:Diphosphomevalonate decarboxylase n=1 Tax=Darwinula stevensoni TaxID=69355 RepID=A0A7R8X4G7_9CRUS|nr:unnamed protein product [Darwinula stevensoni]CAG0886024.1 unnamed protein product [Darwinula stevensoni]
MEKTVTVSAPVNIALIKYWGKRNDKLLLPLNDSLSITLAQDDLRTVTTIQASPDFPTTCLWLNGREEDVSSPRLQNIISGIRNFVKEKCGENIPGIFGWHLHIVSTNNFPTKAGLASSASGYASLTFALAKLYGLDEENLSVIARTGSGSACRSLEGGFVLWNMGKKEDGSDSSSVQLFSHTHWEDLRVFLVVISSSQKSVGSSQGMLRCRETSGLLRQRLLSVGGRKEDLIEAIKRKNFEQFAKLVMQDSNEMHAVCLDSYPPLMYMNDASHAVCQIVHEYNSAIGQTVVAYTFDAGPNPCLMMQESISSDFMGLLEYFSGVMKNGTWKGIPVSRKYPSDELLSKIPSAQSPKPIPVEMIISTRIGEGPQVLPQDSSLIDSFGFPVIYG